MAFKLPLNHEQMFSEILDKCFFLIDIGFWSRIDRFSLEEWLKNFTTDEEKFFAIQLLFHFQFRNKKAMVSMFKQIIQVLLPQKLEELNIYKVENIQEWENKLKTENKELFALPFRFSTINKKGYIGESGDALFRLMAQENIVNKKFGRFIDNINASCKVVVLVDDITGSGDQFKDFFERYNKSFNQFEYIIYAPLVAHEDALKRLKSLDSRIHVISPEVLTANESFYNIFDENNLNKNYVDFTNEIMSNHKLKIKFPFGYSNQAILYGLELSTPNNNHSFIYHDKKWNPLLRR